MSSVLRSENDVLHSSLDVGMVLGRFGASAIVCRAVATYELAGMRAAKKLEKPEVVKKTSVVDLEKKRCRDQIGDFNY